MADTPQPERLGQLNRLESLSNAELQKVIAAGRHVHLPADWALIQEQTPADKAYLIIDGEVSVRRHGEEIARLGPGDVIGEMAIVRHRLRSASVVSLTPLEVIHFTSEAVNQLADQVPAFAAAIRATADDRLPGDGARG
jgi:CRP-like cAMP-binding protein